MIILDTNVISEMMLAEPHTGVRAWLNDQTVRTFSHSSLTVILRSSESYGHKVQVINPWQQ